MRVRLRQHANNGAIPENDKVILHVCRCVSHGEWVDRVLNEASYDQAEHGAHVRVSLSKYASSTAVRAFRAMSIGRTS